MVEDMKRLFFMACAALAACAVSCSKDVQPVKVDTDVKMVPVKISAEPVQQTKTIAIEDGSIFNVNWKGNESIGVFNSNNGDVAEFKAACGESSPSAEFSGELPEGAAANYAAYPYFINSVRTGNNVTVRISPEQDGTFKNVILAGVRKDGAETVRDNYSFQFEAVSSIVKITVPEKVGAEGDQQKVVSMTLIANVPIAGDCKIDYSGEKPVLVPDPDEVGSNLYNAITIEDANGLDGVYYLTTFPIIKDKDGKALNDLDVVLKLVGNDDRVIYKEATLHAKGTDDPGVLRANVIKNIGTVKNVEFPVTPHPGTSGEFSISMKWEGSTKIFRKVTFANGNLQYRASDSKWRFALNSWDTQGDLGNGTLPEIEGGIYKGEGERATQSEWIDLFRYGYTGWTWGGKVRYPYSCLSDDNLNEQNITNTDGDWGRFCDILNGDQVDPKGTWRLLTETEVEYIAGFKNPDGNESTVRPVNTVSRKVKSHAGAQVECTAKLRWMRCKVLVGDEYRYGMMFFPDGFSWPENDPDFPEVPYVANSQATTLAIGYRYITDEDCPVYSMTDFAKFEKLGCVFLPCAGYRPAYENEKPGEFGVYSFNVTGYYYTSNPRCMSFYEKNLGCIHTVGSYLGASVRLVKDVKE